MLINKTYLTCAKIFGLYLIIASNLCSLSPPLYLNQSLNQVLRPASYQNGKGKPENIFPVKPEIYPNRVNITPPSDLSGKLVEGLTKFEVITTEGLVEVTLADGRVTLVPAGDKYNPSLSRLSQPLSQAEINAILPEFQGTPLGITKGRLLALHIIALEQSKVFPELKKNKYIEFNVDMLPDFDPNIDSPVRNFVNSILEAVANELWQHKIDKRYARADRRIYIDFVSRKGDTVKRDAVITLFNRLRIVDDHKLYELLRAAPEDTDLSDKLIITYQGDSAEFQYPALMLKTEAISEKTVMVYPWDTVMDLSVGILSIDRTKPLANQTKVYCAIKNLFEVLTKREVAEDLLDRFLSNNPQEYTKAALELVLPPVQELDLKAIDDLNRIISEVAKYA